MSTINITEDEAKAASASGLEAFAGIAGSGGLGYTDVPDLDRIAGAMSLHPATVAGALGLDPSRTTPQAVSDGVFGAYVKASAEASLADHLAAMNARRAAARSGSMSAILRSSGAGRSEVETAAALAAGGDPAYFDLIRAKALF